VPNQRNLSRRQIELLDGILLGYGRIHKSKNRIEYGPIPKDYGKWLADVFSDQGGRLVKGNRGDWEFRTAPRDWVESWRKRWYRRNRKTIPFRRESSNPVRLLFTPVSATIWFRDRGERESHGRIRFDMNSIEYSTQNGIRLLDEAKGLEGLEMFGDIYMRGKEAEKFLDWILIEQ
jgi:hypothetical protein